MKNNSSQRLHNFPKKLFIDVGKEDRDSIFRNFESEDSFENHTDCEHDKSDDLIAERLVLPDIFQKNRGLTTKNSLHSTSRDSITSTSSTKFVPRKSEAGRRWEELSRTRSRSISLSQPDEPAILLSTLSSEMASILLCPSIDQLDSVDGGEQQLRWPLSPTDMNVTTSDSPKTILKRNISNEYRKCFFKKDQISPLSI